MAIVDKILLNGTSYDIQDTATLQKVENVSDAVNGKPTAEISYDESNSSLDITTGTITVTPAEAADAENAEATLTRSQNSISAVKLDGTTYGLSAGGGDLKIAEVSLGSVTFNPSGATTYTPYKTVAIPSNKIVSITPVAPTALYPFAITMYPQGNNTRLVGAAFGTHGDTMPNTQEVFARIVYSDTALDIEPL